MLMQFQSSFSNIVLTAIETVISEISTSVLLTPVSLSAASVLEAYGIALGNM
jgi:hypothetical protein